MSPRFRESLTGTGDCTGDLLGGTAMDLVESMDCGFIATDLKGRIQVANTAAEALLRVPHASLLGHPLDLLFGEQGLPDGLREGIRRAGQEHAAPERFVEHRDAGSQWLEFRLEPRGARLWFFLRDVTEEHAAATTQRARPAPGPPEDAVESVLRYVLAHVPHAIFWKDRDGRFLGANQDFLDDAGVASLRDLVGKTDFDIWSNATEAAFFVKVDQEVMRSGRPRLNIEEPVLRPDGQHRFVLTSKVPMRDASGQVTGLLGIYADITERKQMEETLRETRDIAEKAARARGDFLTVMSHELRTPLTLILGPVGELLSTRADEVSSSATGDLETVYRNAERLCLLVDDILDYQKLEAGKLRVDWESVDLPRLVERIVDDARPAATSRRLDLRLDVDATLGVVPLDRRMFEKILLNLVGNALKFTPPGGHIRVALRPEGDRVALSVEDTGPGIPKHQQDLIFERFQQLDASSMRKHEGSGLGLAIVKQFAERLGGQVSVESSPGAGARFTVRLRRHADDVIPRPRSEEAAKTVSRTGYFQRRGAEQEKPARAATRRRTGQNAARLLIADDNPDMRAYLASILAADYELELTGTGQQAWEAVRQRRHDVILSDVMMPGMDGFELASRLKADPAYKDIPLILLTARARREEVVGGLEAGADDYLGKPFRPSELKARVRAAERLHRGYLELRRTQEELVQTAKRAAVGTLIAGLSHELNNPMAAIRMNTQLLLRHALGPDATQRALLALERQSRRCEVLLKALHELAQPTLEGKEDCELDALLQRVMGQAAPSADRGSVTLTRAAAPSGEHWMHVNVAEVESALLNVISNAVEASPAGATVHIGATPHQHQGHDGVEISVSDQGPGIPSELLARVFEPFFTTRPVGQGTGLGLALTQRFIDQQGGSVRLDSEPGRGTTVRLWLPTQAPPASAPHRPSDPKAAPWAG